MKNKFWKGFLIGCLSSAVIFLLLSFFAIKIFIGIVTYPSKEYTDPKDYQLIKEKIVKQEKIKHFPKTIPHNAKNVELYGFSNMPYAGEAIMLSFFIDKEYVESELKKYDFINKKDKIGQKQKLYHVYKMNDKFDENEYTYYLLRDKENEKYYKKLFPYFNGIGVNKNQTRILYYYMMYGD